jgi:hypothetical protein
MRKLSDPRHLRQAGAAGQQRGSARTCRIRIFFPAVGAACLAIGFVSDLGAGTWKESVFEHEPATRRQWEVGLETAGIFGVRNPNRYVLAPQLLSIAWQPFPEWTLGGLRVRGQVLATFAGEAIVHGPESYFLAGALRLRLIFPLGDSRWSFYADTGAGIGGVDSNDSPYGQGQDLTFCLITSGGMRYAVSERWSMWAGLLWQHLSNADMSEPRRRNTGLDALGPVLGVSFGF